MTATLRRIAPDSYVNAGQWSQPIYIASSSDPMGVILPDNVSLRVPAGATPSEPAGGDQNLHIIDPTHRVGDEMWSASGSGATWHAGYHVRTDLTGSGMGQGGVRAFGGSVFGGMIRSFDLDRGEIRHALAVAIERPSLRRGPVWPAISEDSWAASAYRGNVPMGTLLAIPAGVDVTSLGLSAQGLMLARALQRYGAYVSDSTEGGVLFYAEPSSESKIAPMRDDVAEIAALLRVVTNNSPTSVGGGGTPLAPFAPPLG